MTKKQKKIKTGDKTIDALYNAVRDYVEKKGGSVVIIGNIAIVKETPLKYNYGVMVRVMGKLPKIKK